APVEAQPANVLLDRIDVLLLLLDRVGVVEAQVAAAAELLGNPEVERDRLGVTDVEVPVRLGREAGHDLRDPALAHVGGDDLADEIASLGSVWTIGARAAAAHHLEEISAVLRQVWTQPAPPAAGCRLDDRDGPDIPVQGCPKLPARADAELREHLAQMPFDSA